MQSSAKDLFFIHWMAPCLARLDQQKQLPFGWISCYVDLLSSHTSPLVSLDCGLDLSGSYRCGNKPQCTNSPGISRQKTTSWGSPIPTQNYDQHLLLPRHILNELNGLFIIVLSSRSSALLPPLPLSPVEGSNSALFNTIIQYRFVHFFPSRFRRNDLRASFCFFPKYSFLLSPDKQVSRPFLR